MRQELEKYHYDWYELYRIDPTLTVTERTVDEMLDTKTSLSFEDDGDVRYQEIFQQESPRSRTDLVWEDFLLLDREGLAAGARQGRYPFLREGAFIWGHVEIPLFNHHLFSGWKLRVVTPLDNGAEDPSEKDGWGLVFSHRF